MPTGQKKAKKPTNPRGLREENDDRAAALGVDDAIRTRWSPVPGILASWKTVVRPRLIAAQWSASRSTRRNLVWCLGFGAPKILPILSNTRGLIRANPGCSRLPKC